MHSLHFRKAVVDFVSHQVKFGRMTKEEVCGVLYHMRRTDLIPYGALKNSVLTGDKFIMSELTEKLALRTMVYNEDKVQQSTETQLAKVLLEEEKLFKDMENLLEYAKENRMVSHKQGGVSEVGKRLQTVTPYNFYKAGHGMYRIVMSAEYIGKPVRNEVSELERMTFAHLTTQDYRPIEGYLNSGLMVTDPIDHVSMDNLRPDLRETLPPATYQMGSPVTDYTTQVFELDGYDGYFDNLTEVVDVSTIISP